MQNFDFLIDQAEIWTSFRHHHRNLLFEKFFGDEYKVTTIILQEFPLHDVLQVGFPIDVDVCALTNALNGF